LKEKEYEITRLRSATIKKLDDALDRIAAKINPDSGGLPDVVWLGIMGFIAGIGY